MLKNTLKTTALLAGLGGLFVVVGSYWGPQGALLGLMLGLAFVGGSYWFSDRLAIAQARAVPVTEEEAPGYHTMVRELTAAADMPMPALYLAPSPQPNAFATGRNERHAAVCVTEGLFRILDENEMRGVLAHELSHIRHNDILIGSVAAAVGMAITFIARFAFWGALFGGGGGGGRDNEGGNAMGALFLVILAPLAASLIQLAISRSREYEADRGGAELCGSGEPLARALEKLDVASRQVPMKVDPAQASAYIVNPLAGRTDVSFANLFRTHPSTEDRVARLRSMAV